MVATAGPERFSICSGGEERIGISFRERRRGCREREKERKMWILYPPAQKSRVISHKSCALHLTISHFECLTWNRPDETVELHPPYPYTKCPPYPCSLPNRRVPLFLPYFVRIPLHTSTYIHASPGRLTTFQGAQVPASRSQDYLLRCGFPAPPSETLSYRIIPVIRFRLGGLVPRNFTRDAPVNGTNETFKACVIRFVLSIKSTHCSHLNLYISIV